MKRYQSNAKLISSPVFSPQREKPRSPRGETITGLRKYGHPCGEHKLRNFKARYLTMKQTIREYSNLGKIAHLNSTKSK
jgi:hypothetical protein